MTDNNKIKINRRDLRSDGNEKDIENFPYNTDKLDKEYDRLNEVDSKRFREKIKYKRDDSRTTEGVLDLATSKEVYKLQKKYLKGLGGIISTGKESNIYYTKSNDLSMTSNIIELAVKIYRTRTLDFKKIKKYIEGDIRFSKIGRKSHQIVQTWALKEFKNLSRCFQKGLPVPEPVIVRRNVLVMAFIGKNGIGAPQLRQFNILESKLAFDLYSQAINLLDDLWNKVKLVHGDFSSYNLLVEADKLIMIDLGQSVLTNHHLAKNFLWRDILNTLYFFNNFGIGDEPEKIFQKITGTRATPELFKI